MTCKKCVRRCKCESVRLPADWAIKKALRVEYTDEKVVDCVLRSVKGNPTGSYFRTVAAFARMIEQHEDEPVDPDLELARKVVSQRNKLFHIKDEIMAGEFDAWSSVQIAFDAIKAVRQESVR